MLVPGSKFADDFCIERLLGQGGMGEVYVATQLSTGRRRALKLMHSSFVQDEKLRERFAQEARVGSHIASQHVVEVIGAGVDAASGQPWIAMELLEGEDLATVLSRRGTLNQAEVAEVFGQLCHALGAAHTAGIVHRDLKPENIYLATSQTRDARRTVKVLDFGIAKLLADAQATQATSATGPVGTPLWMSPEQAQAGAAVTPASDVWALGLIAFRALSGKLYWRAANAPGATPLSVLREVAFEPLEPSSKRSAELGGAPLPAGFDDWFARCVARDPAARFRNAAEACAALEAAIGTAPEGSAPALDVGPVSATVPSVPRLATTPSATPSGTSPSAALGTPPGPQDSAPLQVGGTAPGGLRTIGLTVGASVIAALVAVGAVLAWLRPTPPAPAPTPMVSAMPAAVDAGALQTTDAGVLAQTEPVDEGRWKIPVGDSPRLGPDDALVTVMVFANFQCPTSRGAADFLEGLVRTYPGDVRLVWKENPLAIHTRAEAASELAREAMDRLGPEGFWKAYHELFTARRLDDETLASVARRVGIDPEDARSAAKHGRHQPAIDADLELVDAFGVNATPSLFINGRPYTGDTTPEAIAPIIREELEAARKRVAQGTPRARIYEAITARGRGPAALEKRKVPPPLDQSPAYGSLDKGTGVLLIEFGDFSSPFCAWMDPVVDQLRAKYRGKVQVVWFDAPDPKDEDAVRASEAAREAFAQLGETGFIKMKDLLLDHPKGLSQKAIEGYAQKAGLKLKELRASLQDHRYRPVILADIQAARSLGVDLTPSFMFSAFPGGKEGYFVNGAHPVHSFERRIEAALADR